MTGHLDNRRAIFRDPDGVDATWVHRDARTGFECASIRARGDGHRLVGHTCAIEDGVSWAVGYVVDVDAQWRTIGAELTETRSGYRTTLSIQTDRAGRWMIDGAPCPELDECIDIDLESSALTNTIFLHRVQPSSADVYDAPASFIRCAPLRPERLDQTYRLTTQNRIGVSYAYTSPAYGTDIELHFDDAGLVLDYPGLAIRHS